MTTDQEVNRESFEEADSILIAISQTAREIKKKW